MKNELSRDEFAAAALPCLLRVVSADAFNADGATTLAKASYAIADAMLEARGDFLERYKAIIVLRNFVRSMELWIDKEGFDFRERVKDLNRDGYLASAMHTLSRLEDLAGTPDSSQMLYADLPDLEGESFPGNTVRFVRVGDGRLALALPYGPALMNEKLARALRDRLDRYLAEMAPGSGP